MLGEKRDFGPGTKAHEDAQQPKESSNVEFSINKIEEAIYLQDDIIQNLVSRLRPVLIDGPVPGDAETSEAKDTKSVSPLTEKLETLHLSLERNTLRLRLLARNLDV